MPFHDVTPRLDGVQVFRGPPRVPAKTLGLAGAGVAALCAGVFIALPFSSPCLKPLHRHLSPWPMWRSKRGPLPGPALLHWMPSGHAVWARRSATAAARLAVIFQPGLPFPIRAGRIGCSNLW